MSTTASAAALLHAALQDIHAGKQDQSDRLPAIARSCSDASLKALLEQEVRRMVDHAHKISGEGVDVEGPANLWMGGVLDDAERDIRQTQPGRLLDIALIGAIRKGKAAEVVASETAIALAREINAADLLALASALRQEELETEKQLADQLTSLTRQSRSAP